VDGYDLKLSSDERKSVEDDEETKRRRSLGSKGGCGVRGLSEEHAADIQKLIGKYVHFINGVNKARLGYVSSISVAGKCNVLLLQPRDVPRVHACSMPYHLQEVIDFDTLDEDETELVDVHKSHKDKRLATSTEKKVQKEARIKGRRVSDDTEDHDDEELDEETTMKSSKIVKKDTSLCGKYVRIGSGESTGRVGRAVSNTVGNIFSVCVLDLTGVKIGKHTSVTASKLPEIKEEDCTEVEVSAIRNDEILVKKLLEKKNLRMQRSLREKKSPKGPRWTGSNAGHEGGSDNDNQIAQSNLLELPKDAMDKYIRIQTGQYKGLLARVTSIVKRYKCSVKILEAPGCSAFKGTTVTGTNFLLADIETLSDAEKGIYEHDLKMREAAGPNSSSGVREKAPKRVFEVDITGQYIRLMSGMYGGKMARITQCPVGSTPCNVKVQRREMLYIVLCRFCPLFFLTRHLPAQSSHNPRIPYAGDIWDKPF
jgi:hypothetical protein